MKLKIKSIINSIWQKFCNFSDYEQVGIIREKLSNTTSSVFDIYPFTGKGEIFLSQNMNLNIIIFS